MRVVELDSSARRRSWCLVFERGDAVVAGLEAFARTHDVRGAHARALGAFSDATLAYFSWDTKEYEELPVREQVEVAALVGNVGRGEDDAVQVHLHCVLGRRDGAAIAGHLLEATARPTLELVLVDEGAELRRRPDPESGLDLIAP